MLIGDFDEVLAVDDFIEDAVITPLGLPLRVNAALVHAIRGNQQASLDNMAAIDKIVANSSSLQDASSATYAVAMLAFVAGSLRDTQQLARKSREAFSGAYSGMGAVTAARASLLLGDLEGARADRVPLYEERNIGAWLHRWLEVVDAGIAALEGKSGEASLEFSRLVREWHDASCHSTKQ